MISFRKGILKLQGDVSALNLQEYAREHDFAIREDIQELYWKDVEFVPDRMFARSKLQKVELTGNFVEIGTKSFADCEDLVCVDFYATRTEIGDYAFTRCISLKEVDLSKCLMHNGAFCGCSKLRKVKLPERHVLLMRSVFAMTDIEEINTEGVDYVFPHAFAATGRLKSIHFYGHTVIEDLAFMSSEIQEVYLSRDTMVSSDAFAYCRNLEKGFVAYEHGWMGDYLEILMIDGNLGFPPKTDIIELF